VVYANNTPADGSGVGINNRSIIVEYSRSGQMVGTFEVVGKADGLKYNPFDHKLWALRNEDAKPGLTLIDPRSGEKTDYTYAEPPLHGGGYDDVVFTKETTFITGMVTPVVTDMMTPHGALFLPANSEGDEHGDK